MVDFCLKSRGQPLFCFSSGWKTGTDFFWLIIQWAVKDFTLTIPSGVTILNLQANGNAIDTQITEIIIKNKDSGKIWLHNDSFNQDESYEENKYIGVTPDKTYNLNLTITHGGDGEGGSQNNGAFYYSSEINTHTPDIEDYWESI